MVVVIIWVVLVILIAGLSQAGCLRTQRVFLSYRRRAACAPGGLPLSSLRVA